MVEEVKQVSKAPDGTVTTIKTTKTIKKANQKDNTPIPKRPKTYNKSRMSAREREELLIENFVGLQKAMTHLSIKFEGLSENISKLLEVFELSAKTQVENSDKKEDKEVLSKINSLLGQNKVIAKGLVLIDEKLNDGDSHHGEQEGPHIHRESQSHQRPPMPPRRPPMPPRQPPRKKPLPRI